MPSDPSAQANANGKTCWLCADVIVLIVAAAVLILFRAHAFGLPLETDECNYAYIGERLLEGDELYVDVWDHQPPGVFALFAGVISVFGSDPVVFRWLATGASLVTLFCLYGCSLCAFGRECAVCTAVLFAIVSSDPGTGGEGCNREVFMNALIAVAWFAVMSRERACAWTLFVAGLALGLASVIKTIVAVHWFFLAIVIVMERSRTRHLGPQTSSVRRGLGDVAALGAFPAIIWAGVLGYFGATGRFGAFYDAVFGFNVGYSGGGGAFLSRFVAFFAPERHPFIFDSAIALWLASAVAVVWMLHRTIRGERACAIVLAWLLGAYVAVCLPGRFWPHYYYLLIPPACIATAWVFWCAVGAFRDRFGGARWTPVAGCFVLILPVLATEYSDYLDQPPFGVTVKRYNSRDFWGRAQGENIKRVTQPGDKVFVYGNEASLYYYADRRCASRYTMITGIGAGMVGAGARRKTMMDELRSDPPRLIVVLFDEQPFPEWKAFLDEFYGEPVGWDLHDKTREPIMFVMVRRDQPIDATDWDWDRSLVGGWQLGERLR